MSLRLAALAALASLAVLAALFLSAASAGAQATAPTVSSATVDGTTLTVTFDENLDTASAPAGSVFTVTGGRAGTGTVTISGATATVTLDAAVLRGDTVTVSYAKPASNPLQDSDGSDVESFSDQTVTNNTGNLVDATGDHTDCTSSSSCVHVPTGSAVPGPQDGQITLTWTPATTGAAATEWSVSSRVSGGSYSGTTKGAGARSHTFTGLDQTKTYDIRINGSRNFFDLGRVAEVLGISADATAPTFSSATVDGTTLVVTFSENLDTRSVPAASRFTVSGGRTGTGAVSISGATATLTLNSAVPAGATVTVSYAKPTSGQPLQDAVGHDLASFSNQAVTNNSTAPTVSSAVLGANGTTLEVRLSETNLQGHNSRNFWTYKVDGVNQGTVQATSTHLTPGLVSITLAPAVKQGQTVLLSYSKPTSNPLRDQAGNNLASFSDMAVTNNSNQQAGGGQPPPSNHNPSNNNPGANRTPAPPPIDPNLAYSPVEWRPNPHPMMQAFPLVMSEISSNRTRNGSGSLDFYAIAASLSPQRAARSQGYFLSTRVYALAEQPALVRRASGGASHILAAGGVRHRVVKGSPLVQVKLWHIYRRADTGVNTIERLGGPWHPRPETLLARPVEVCLPAPRADAAIAVRLQGESAWTILETTEQDGQICADTRRVGWFILVDATEDQAA